MKRGASGLSLVLAVDKPAGKTSHDVVNKVRGLASERRVGHAGTLDPLATGLLPILIGPATRLNQYISSDDKSYTARIVFGVSTTTDDMEGEVIHRSTVPLSVLDRDFAQSVCDGFLGKSKQVPPVYSAIKVNGRVAHKEARAGKAINLEPRSIEVYSARLLDLGVLEDGGFSGQPYWEVDFCVSKGTYIRSLARDIGKACGTHGFIGALRRTSIGDLDIEDAIDVYNASFDVVHYAVDPIKLLDFKIAFPSDAASLKMDNGAPLGLDEVSVFEKCGSNAHICECMPSIMQTEASFNDGEKVAVVANNALKAIYRYDDATASLRAECIFQIGVRRGAFIDCAE